MRRSLLLPLVLIGLAFPAGLGLAVYTASGSALDPPGATAQVPTGEIGRPSIPPRTIDDSTTTGTTTEETTTFDETTTLTFELVRHAALDLEKDQRFKDYPLEKSDLQNYLGVMLATLGHPKSRRLGREPCRKSIR